MYDAEIVDVCSRSVAAVAMVKVALDAPAGTATVAGGRAAELLLESAMTAPPAGAASLRLTIPTASSWLVTADGATDTLTSAAAGTGAGAGIGVGVGVGAGDGDGDVADAALLPPHDATDDAAAAIAIALTTTMKSRRRMDSGAATAGYTIARVLPSDVLPAPELLQVRRGRAPSSVVEHVTFNHGVLGSIPRGPTI